MKRAELSLTFIIPGLIDPVPYLKQLPVKDLPELPTFSKILSRGKLSTAELPAANSPDNLYQCLLKELTPAADVNLISQSSIAALSYAVDAPQTHMADKWIMRADPCFLVADRDQLVMAQSGAQELTLSEAIALAEEINHFFAAYEEENFWKLKVLTPDRWYIISDKAITLPSIPPENVLGQSVKNFLFSTESEEGRHWMNLFNETQMILHQSDVNKKRLAEKKTPVNSLWFWGAGQQIQLPEKKLENNAKVVYADNFIAQNIAQFYGMNTRALTKSLDINEYLSTPDNKIEHIIIVRDDFIRALRNKDIFSWVGLLQQFEENYLQLLVKALNDGKIQQLEFVSPSGQRLRVSKKSLGRWWKKHQPYHTFF